MRTETASVFCFECGSLLNLTGVKIARFVMPLGMIRLNAKCAGNFGCLNEFSIWRQWESHQSSEDVPRRLCTYFEYRGVQLENDETIHGHCLECGTQISLDRLKGKRPGIKIGRERSIVFCPKCNGHFSYWGKVFNPSGKCILRIKIPNQPEQKERADKILTAQSHSQKVESKWLKITDRPQQ